MTMCYYNSHSQMRKQKHKVVKYRLQGKLRNPDLNTGILASESIVSTTAANCLRKLKLRKMFLIDRSEPKQSIFTHSLDNRLWNKPPHNLLIIFTWLYCFKRLLPQQMALLFITEMKYQLFNGKTNKHSVS